MHKHIKHTQIRQILQELVNEVYFMCKWLIKASPEMKKATSVTPNINEQKCTLISIVCGIIIDRLHNYCNSISKVKCLYLPCSASSPTNNIMSMFWVFKALWSFNNISVFFATSSWQVCPVPKQRETNTCSVGKAQRESSRN